MQQQISPVRVIGFEEEKKVEEGEDGKAEEESDYLGSLPSEDQINQDLVNHNILGDIQPKMLISPKMLEENKSSLHRIEQK